MDETKPGKVFVVEGEGAGVGRFFRQLGNRRIFCNNESGDSIRFWIKHS